MSLDKLLTSKNTQAERAFFLASRVEEHIEYLSSIIAEAHVVSFKDKHPTLSKIMTFLHPDWFDIILERGMPEARVDATAMLLLDISNAVIESYTPSKTEARAKVKPKAKAKEKVHAS